jgi:hypothetical protein
LTYRASRSGGGSFGRSLLHREPDAADFQAGFSIRLD